VIIFRGDGGRECARRYAEGNAGASIEYVSCYRRGRPRIDPAPLLKLWEQGRLDAVTLTSSEGLRNFFDMVGRLGQAWLKQDAGLRAAPAHRRAGTGAGPGVRVIPTGPGDDGLMAGLVQYFASHGNSAAN
jgi:uroporphyrinogen-III synthase